MTQVVVGSADVTLAANFLEQFLTDQVPEGDFTQGTSLRDLTVKALAAVVAFMRKDATLGLQLRSLVTVKDAVGSDPDALADAVTAILSNFFIPPKGGQKSRGFVVGHSSRQVDIFVPITTRFTYSQGLVFVVDSSDVLFIPAAQLVPIVDADNAVLDYEFRVPLVATQTGDAYDVEPSLFSDFDRFSPYVTRIESTAKFSGGKGPETVDEILARAPTAVSVRNLINDRSIDATLNDNFDGIESLLVVGFGDPEMQRDLVPGVAPHLRIHVGGMTDIYLRTALADAEFVGTVGDLFERPDGVSSMFRDAAEDFTAPPAVSPGDVIRVTAGLPSTPSEFLVVQVLDANTLVVSERSPFPLSSDEADPPTTVSYVIGRVGPSYNDVRSDVGGAPLVTGVTSRRISSPGRIVLPGGPVMDVLDVAITNPPVGEAAFKSTLDGFVHFPNQVNTVPSDVATPDAGLQFQTVVHSPTYAQSALQWMDVVVGTDDRPDRFDGLLLRVRYRTLASFAPIDSFVRGRRERVTAAFQLPRGHHPVVVRMHVRYTLKTTAVATLNNDNIARSIVDFVNGFDATSTPIDVSAVTQLVRNAYPDVGPIEPITIEYDLRAPTGDVMSYQTTDVVRVIPDRQVAGPALDLDSLGVTNRTLRYISNTAGVTVEAL
jgi:hypothetical protein